MDASKHTPGPAPWRYEQYHRVWDANGDPVAKPYGKTFGAQDAHGHLIAAAPELLEALKELQGAIGGYMLSRGEERERWHYRLKNDVAERVHAAISAATGEPT